MEQSLVPGVLVPGVLVRHPGRPDWGLGQVQSVIGTRATVNFEHAGKVLILTDAVTLSVIDPEELAGSVGVTRR